MKEEREDGVGVTRRCWVGLCVWVKVGRRVCVGECIRKGGVAEEEGMAWESLSGRVCG